MTLGLALDPMLMLNCNDTDYHSEPVISVKQLALIFSLCRSDNSSAIFSAAEVNNEFMFA